MCQSPVPALVTRTASPRPRRRNWSANIFSAIGERQMLPVQTKVTCNGFDTQRPPQVGDGGGMCDAGGRCAPVSEVGLPVSPADHHGVDPVRGGPVHIVTAVAD